MHGVIFDEVKEYVETNHGSDQWDAILAEAGLGGKSYMAIKTYPDEELLAIIETAMDATGTSQEELLVDFGKFAGPHLLEKYDAFLEREWDGLDVLEHTEDAMHKAVRLKEDDAAPPELDCRRVSDDEVVIEYTSDYQLCKLGEGLIHGIADAYDEQVTVRQSQCMLEHDSRCEIHIQR
jgi:predicted hydrocarbon binding protein